MHLLYNNSLVEIDFLDGSFLDIYYRNGVSGRAKGFTLFKFKFWQDVLFKRIDFGLGRIRICVGCGIFSFFYDKS